MAMTAKRAEARPSIAMIRLSVRMRGTPQRHPRLRLPQTPPSATLMLDELV
jgi:hypothetical protein